MYESRLSKVSRNHFRCSEQEGIEYRELPALTLLVELGSEGQGNLANIKNLGSAGKARNQYLISSH